MGCTSVDGASDKLAIMIESTLGLLGDQEKRRTDPDPSLSEPEPEKKT